MPEPKCVGPDLPAIFAQYLSDLEVRARPRAVLAARRALERFERELPSVTVRSVMAWREARVRAGATNATANGDVAYLRAALKLAVRLGDLPSDPLAGLTALPISARHQRRKPRALTDWELSRLLAEAEASDRRRPHRFPQAPLLFALAMTGARWGELSVATWGDLDLERGLLVFRAETTKTETERAIPLREDLLEVLLSLRKPTELVTGSPPQPGSRIFLTPTGKPQFRTVVNFRTWFLELLDAASIPRKDERGRVVCIHALRHTFATRLARSGVPLATAQVLTGHRTPGVLLGIYTHLRAEDARSAVNALTPLGVGASVKTSEGGVQTARAAGLST